MKANWHAVVLAAGRGPNDPMAKAYGVLHKCSIDIAGTPMLRRVVQTLAAHPAIASVTISIDDASVATKAIAGLAGNIRIVSSADTAAESALSAVGHIGHRYPVLLTTGDHPLLTAGMLDHFLAEAENAKSDLSVGLASAETILAAFPETKRTYLTFGKDRVSGCNLYALMNEGALEALRFWSSLDQLRKKPWRLVGAFGAVPLIRYLTGAIDLKGAFVLASKRLGLIAAPILMPFAEASIDVDKPSDKELVEKIIAGRN